MKARCNLARRIMKTVRIKIRSINVSDIEQNSENSFFFIYIN